MSRKALASVGVVLLLLMLIKLLTLFLGGPLEIVALGYFILKMEISETTIPVPIIIFILSLLVWNLLAGVELSTTGYPVRKPVGAMLLCMLFAALITVLQPPERILLSMLSLVAIFTSPHMIYTLWMNKEPAMTNSY